MGIFASLFYILIGAFFIWMGSFQLIASMLPDDAALDMAKAHGKWTRENIFKLPPTEQKEQENVR